MTEKPLLLILGHRKGLAKALKDRSVEHIHLLKKPKKSIPEALICGQFPQNQEDVRALCLKYSEKLKGITQVVASGEGSMKTSNLLRQELGLVHYSDEVIEGCSDKLYMKDYLKGFNIPMTAYLSGETSLDSKDIYRELGAKVVAKDKNNSGGRGQQIYRSPEPILKDKNQLIEGFILGKEMSIESFVLNNEIVFSSTTQYLEIGAVNLVPAAVEDELLNKVRDLNKAVIEALNIPFGLTHLEVYLTSEGVLFGEVALRPPGGYIMELMNLSHGIDSWGHYLDLHLGREFEIVKSKSEFSVAVVYHPGEGTADQVVGEQIVKNLESLVDYKISARPGKEIKKRVGIGQESAHFLLNNSKREKVLEDLNLLTSSFRVCLQQEDLLQA